MKKDCQVQNPINNNASSNNRAGQGRFNGNNQGNGRNGNNSSTQQGNIGPREGSKQGQQQNNNGGGNCSNNPKFKAPVPNEPQECNHNGRKEFWCSYHCRWLPPHGTNGCCANGMRQANIASNGSGSLSQVSNTSVSNDNGQGNTSQWGQNDSASLAFLGGGWELGDRMWQYGQGWRLARCYLEAIFVPNPWRDTGVGSFFRVFMFCLVFLVYVFSLGSLFFSSILAENPVPTMVFIEFWIRLGCFISWVSGSTFKVNHQSQLRLNFM